MKVVSFREYLLATDYLEVKSTVTGSHIWSSLSLCPGSFTAILSAQGPVVLPLLSTQRGRGVLSLNIILLHVATSQSPQSVFIGLNSHPLSLFVPQFVGKMSFGQGKEELKARSGSVKTRHSFPIALFRPTERLYPLRMRSAD
ncbi:hypothetical protein RRG08_023785 [Elysia crispata]|uniref:Uncharacterized protein n=1 Tax=Elysia crispata TaxID=231223 RepID=A0AAE0ZW36_9GAST|nr:hypothetical protein RRG08_023785 [Elysia crispata]